MGPRPEHAGNDNKQYNLQCKRGVNNFIASVSQNVICSAVEALTDELLSITCLQLILLSAGLLHRPVSGYGRTILQCYDGLSLFGELRRMPVKSTCANLLFLICHQTNLPARQ